MAQITARHGIKAPASPNHAFNVGYSTVYPVSRPNFTRLIPAGPIHGCVSCGYSPHFAAQPSPPAPPNVSPGHPGTSGINMPTAPRQPAPSATLCPPPEFGSLSSPPVANTTPGYPFTSPPPPSFPFNPDMAGSTAGQAPPVAPSSVACSTNPACLTVFSNVGVSPYRQLDSRYRSTSFQRVARRDHRRTRSHSPAPYSRPCVSGALGRSSQERRPVVPGADRRVVHQQLSVVAPLTRSQSQQQHPSGAGPRTTIFFCWSPGSSPPIISVGH